MHLFVLSINQLQRQRVDGAYQLRKAQSLNHNITPISQFTKVSRARRYNRIDRQDKQGLVYSLNQCLAKSSDGSENQASERGLRQQSGLLPTSDYYCYFCVSVLNLIKIELTEIVIDRDKELKFKQSQRFKSYFINAQKK